MKLIDLSHPLVHGQDNFPFDPKLSIISHSTTGTLRYNMTHDEPFGVTAPSREITRTIGNRQVKISLNDAEYLDFVTKAGKAVRSYLGTAYQSRDLTEKDVDNIKDIIRRVQGVYRDEALVNAMRARKLN